MLSTIPTRILRDTLTLTVPTGFDRYQKPLAPKTYTVTRVHLQSDNSTRKTATNTEVTLRGILFVDARLRTGSQCSAADFTGSFADCTLAPESRDTFRGGCS